MLFFKKLYLSKLYLNLLVQKLVEKKIQKKIMHYSNENHVTLKTHSSGKFFFYSMN
jgi:hypothetical protein